MRLCPYAPIPLSLKAPSNLAIAGRYIFSPVIFDMIRSVKPDKRNEIQLTDAIQFMCDEGRRVIAVKLTPEEKRVITFIIAAFLLGVATKCYRDTHPQRPMQIDKKHSYSNKTHP